MKYSLYILLVILTTILLTYFMSYEAQSETEVTDAERMSLTVDDHELTHSYEWETSVTASVSDNPCNICLRTSNPKNCLNECDSKIIVSE